MTGERSGRRWRGTHHLGSGIVACIAALLLTSPAAAQRVESAPEHSIKAAYLYNFAAYIDWPADSFPPGEPLAIGVLGDDSLAGELEKITRDRHVHGRSVDVRRLQPGDGLAGLHMLFVAAEREEAVTELAAEARRRSVLVVTESGHGLGAGGIINFLLIDRRVRFEVSLEAADASGIGISSRLLAVAERVLPGSGE